MTITDTCLMWLINAGGVPIQKITCKELQDYVLANTPGYKTLIGRFNEPTSLTIFQNTLGFVPTIVHNVTGYFYVVAPDGGFPHNKTWISATWGAIDSDQGNSMNAYVSQNNKQIEIQIRTPAQTLDFTWNSIDGQIEDLFLEIRVYP